MRTMLSHTPTSQNLRWTTLHPEHWTTNEVAGWITSVIEANKQISLDHHAISQAFETISGCQLLKMTKDDFVNIQGQYGEFMYDVFRAVYTTVPVLDDTETHHLLRSLTPISETTDSDHSPEGTTLAARRLDPGTETTPPRETPCNKDESSKGDG